MYKFNWFINVDKGKSGERNLDGDPKKPGTHKGCNLGFETQFGDTGKSRNEEYDFNVCKEVQRENFP